jgi:glutamate-1-semialdehyde 2,1-aminomutase
MVLSRTRRSARLFSRASKVLVGGVNSPVRAFSAVGGQPLFIRRAAGAHIQDVDRNRYIDYVMSWGPLIHGHAPRGLRRALAAATARGTSFGAPHELEIALAERIRALMPSIERIRFVNSGTEAAMSAIRVARAATGRDRFIKFDGCYHGHADPFLVKAGSGAMTLGAPTSPGVPAAAAGDTLVASYNNLRSVERLFASNRGQIAAVIIEPIAGNMGVVSPAAGFLAGLRTLCTQEGAVLIFDEVISGFRASPGGAQRLYGIRPDLTCFGKIIGGGLPVGAYGGRTDLMELVAPKGPVYQAGTLSGNPLAMAAGLWTLEALSPGLYARLGTLTERLSGGLAGAAREHGLALQVNAAGSVLTPFFTSLPVGDVRSAGSANTAQYAAFFQGMLAHGIYPPPSQFEAWFLSGAHTAQDIDETIKAARATFAEMVKREGLHPASSPPFARIS